MKINIHPHTLTMEIRETKHMPPPVNFRAFLLVASAVVGAVFCAYIFMLDRVAGVIIGIIYLCALLSLTVVFALKFRKKLTSLAKLLSLLIALVFSVTAFSVAVAYTEFRNASLELDGVHYVDGRLCDVDIRNGNYILILDDLAFDGQDVKGKLKVTVSATYHNNADFLYIGDRVLFSSRIVCVPLVSNGKVNGTSFRTGIIFSCSVRGDGFEIEFGDPKPLEKFLANVKRILIDNMGYKYGNIAYSMLTGDKYGLSSDVSSVFSAAGIGHILAVSGLHVGFLLLIVRLLLSRANKYVRFAVTIALLCAYVVIADFSPSVVRAAVMAVIACSSVFVGGRRDILSSMFCAFSCILAFRPLYLFEAGFLMSFGAIFGIAMFANSISRFLTSHNINRKIAGSVGTALSVQAGILPTQTYFFGIVQPLAVVVNIFVLPYIGIVFIAILVCLPFAAIPGLGMAVGWCRYLLMPVDYIAQGFAAMPISSIAVSPSCAAFLCYPIMFFASDFFILPKSKLPLALFSVALCAVLASYEFAFRPKRYQLLIISVTATDSSVGVFSLEII